jgi:hypothetical protein
MIGYIKIRQLKLKEKRKNNDGCYQWYIFCNRNSRQSFRLKQKNSNAYEDDKHSAKPNYIDKTIFTFL